MKPKPMVAEINITLYVDDGGWWQARLGHHLGDRYYCAAAAVDGLFDDLNLHGYTAAIERRDAMYRAVNGADNG